MQAALLKEGSREQEGMGIATLSLPHISLFFGMFYVQRCGVQFAAFWKRCVCTGKLNSYLSLFSASVSVAKVGL